jgi:hypothetical protein
MASQTATTTTTTFTKTVRFSLRANGTVTVSSGRSPKLPRKTAYLPFFSQSAEGTKALLHPL